MKLTAAIGAFSFLLLASSNAAVAFWAFQTDLAGTAGQSTPNHVSGFPGEQSITKINGNASSVNSGGQGTFNYEGQNYLGSNGGTGDANSFGWNAGSTQNFTGSGFTLGLDLTGITDLSVEFSIRAAMISGATTPPSTFRLIEFSLNGNDWTPLASNLYPTWTTNGVWQRRTIDFTGIDEIEDQGSVEIRFFFTDTANSIEASSIRIDNLLLTAVPEPSAALLLGFSALAVMSRRRR